MGEEIADVIGYSMALANELGIDLSSTIRAKMIKNAQKYPAEKFRGRFGTRRQRPAHSITRDTADCHRRRQRAGGRGIGRAGRVSSRSPPICLPTPISAGSQRRPASTIIRTGFSIGCADLLRNRRLGCTPAHSKIILNSSIAWRAVAPLWGNGGEVLRRVRSPRKAGRRVAKRRIFCFPKLATRPPACPMTVPGWQKLATAPAAAAFERSRCDRRGLTAFSISAELLARRIPRSLLQPRAKSRFSAVGAAAGRRTLAARARIPILRGDRPMCRSPRTVQAEIERIGHVLAQEFGLGGLFGVDLMIDGDRSGRLKSIRATPRRSKSVERCTGLPRRQQPTPRRAAMACSPTPFPPRTDVTLRQSNSVCQANRDSLLDVCRLGAHGSAQSSLAGAR